MSDWDDPNYGGERDRHCLKCGYPVCQCYAIQDRLDQEELGDKNKQIHDYLENGDKK